MPLPGQAAFWTSQVQQELADLEWIRSAVATAALEVRLGQTVQDRFELLINRYVRRLRDLLDGKGEPAVDWETLQGVRRDAAVVKREALAFLEGQLLQRHALDKRFTAAATGLLDDLTWRTGIDHKVLMTVADSEFLEHTTGMLRLRFTDTTVWALPVLAHELGHHVARTLPDSDPELHAQIRPAMQFITREGRKEKQASRLPGDQQGSDWLQELFADTYATYTLGPAYPVSVIVLRAGPDLEGKVSSTHPPWSRRVRTMIAALKAMSELPGDPQKMPRYALIADGRVEPLWLRAFGEQPADKLALERSAEQARAMVHLLAKHGLPRLRYPIGGPTETLAEHLPEDTPPVTPGTTPAQVLNAAWLWRLENWSEPAWRISAVSRNALDLCARTAAEARRRQKEEPDA